MDIPRIRVLSKVIRRLIYTGQFRPQYSNAHLPSLQSAAQVETHTS